MHGTLLWRGVCASLLAAVAQLAALALTPSSSATGPEPSPTRGAAPPLNAIPVSQTSVAAECQATALGRDPRFGVILSGSEADPPATLQSLGATDWFRFDSGG